MRRHHDQLAGAELESAKLGNGRRAAHHPVARFQEGINHGVARHDDALAGNPFLQQVIARPVGGGKVQGGQMRSQAAVNLLRERRVPVQGAQTRFHVAHGHAVIESRQARHHDRGGVSLHQDDVRPVGGEHFMKPLQNQGGQPAQFLIGPHHVEIVMNGDAKPAQDGLQQVAVLRGDADAGLELISMPPQFTNHGGELDGFGARAQNDEDVKTFSRHGRDFRFWILD